MTRTKLLAARARVHWRDLRSRPAAWIALPRNLIPAFGVIALGWSGLEAVIYLWVDLTLAFLCLLGALVPRALADTAEKPDSRLKRIGVGIFTFVFLAAILGIPIWLALGMLISHVREAVPPGGLMAILGSTAFLTSVAAAAVGHALATRAAGFDRIGDDVLVRQLRLAFWPLFLRALVMLYIIGLSIFPALFLVLVALLQTWLDWWPETATRWAHGRNWDKLDTGSRLPGSNDTRRRLDARMAELRQRGREAGR